MNKVITVIDQYNPFRGGAENLARVIAEKTSIKLVSHNVLTLANRELDKINGKALPPREKISVNHSIFRFRYVKIGGAEKNGPYFQYITLMKYIYHLIKLRDTYDIIHAHTYYWPATAGIVAGKILRKSVVVTGHSTLVRLQEEVLAKQVPSFFLPVLKYSDYYIAINDTIAQEAQEICLIPQDKIKVIYNGIDTEQYKPTDSKKEKDSIRANLGLQLNKIIIVYHGRLDKNKDIQTLLYAIKQIIGEFDKNPLFLIIGQGPYKQKLLNIVNKNNIQHYVHFIGFKNNINEYLKAADIYCFPSTFEGLPLALLEAMACGLICIASDINGNRAIIDDKQNGFLFETSDVNQLGNILSHTMNSYSDNYYNKIKFNARKTILNSYSLNKMISEYMSLYDSIKN